MRSFVLVLSLCLAAMPGVALAGLAKSEIDTVGVTKRIGAPLKADHLVDLQGEPAPLPASGDKPDLILFVDFTCETSCGVSADALLSRLSGLTLKPGDDFDLSIIGLDPKDGQAEAKTFAEEHIPKTERWQAVRVLRGDKSEIAHLLDTAGVRISYDKERDQFAHPTAAVLLDKTGEIRRYVDPFASEPLDFRLALTDAGDGSVGSLGDRLFLLCYGWNPATGTYSPLIARILAISAALSVAAIATLVLTLLWRERRGKGRESAA
ncbi:hypothetical protein L0F51_08950 [Afifella sp. H1R]|uniref:hypothetical protein n=1 Tax=Afifella sp. H1R TaxID=2908841 RepID=UPI001F322908|nr:hypothetical protein [Afifella sp. H1R]MCF1503888.1 hypothetical protein [Afifella sp. H1R]